MKYEQIVINTVDDLPKEEGSYISKRKTRDYVGTYFYKGEEYNELWYRTIEWYLLPIKDDSESQEPVKEIPSCPNCKETTKPCACMRNICIRCGKPVGNITFTVCDDCWDKPEQPVSEKPVSASQIIKGYERKTDDGLHYITLRDAEKAMEEYHQLKSVQK